MVCAKKFDINIPSSTASTIPILAVFVQPTRAQIPGWTSGSVGLRVVNV